MNLLNVPFDPVATDQAYATISATANTRDQNIAKIQTRIGVIPWIVAIRNSVDAAGLGKILFKTKINGSYAPQPYDFSYSQWCPPEQEIYLPVPIQMNQGGTVQIDVDNNDAANAYNATARLIVVYQSVEDAMRKAGY